MAKFVNIDRESPMLLPYDIRDWVLSVDFDKKSWQTDIKGISSNS